MAYTEKDIWKFLKSKGLTDAGVAGLMGNLYAESHFGFNILETLCIKRIKEDTGKVWTSEEYTKAIDNGTISYEQFLAPRLPKRKPNNTDYQYGYGLCQWTTKSRKKGLYNNTVAKGLSIADPEAQLDYLIYELKNIYKSVYQVLITTHDVREATLKVLINFESPSGKETAAVQNPRIAYANEYYNKYHCIQGWSQNDDKTWVYSDDGNSLVKSEWRKINGCYYYFNSDGIAVTGEQTINGKRYYFEPTSGAEKECARMITDKDGSLIIERI